MILLTIFKFYDKTVMSYDKFNEIFIKLLHIHAHPLQKMIIRGNHRPLMNKSLSEAFMERSRLKNKFNKHPTDLNRQLYNKKNNSSVSLVKKERRKYYKSRFNYISRYHFSLINRNLWEGTSI